MVGVPDLAMSTKHCFFVEAACEGTCTACAHCVDPAESVRGGREVCAFGMPCVVVRHKMHGRTDLFTSLPLLTTVGFALHSGTNSCAK